MRRILIATLVLVLVPVAAGAQAAPQQQRIGCMFVPAQNGDVDTYACAD